MITYLGEISIGAAIPVPYAAVLDAFADLQARVAALANLSITVQPTSYPAQLLLLAQMVANIEAMIALGLSPPSIAIQITATLALVDELRLKLSLILAIPFDSTLHAFVYTGPTDLLGPEVTTALSAGLPGSGVTSDTLALVFAATSAESKAAMTVVFKTS